MFEIVSKERLSENIVEFKIKAPLVAKKAKPGHFIFVRLDETGERVPLTVADYDREEGTVTIVVQEIGKTTIQMGKLESKDTILDFVGPLGVPAHIEKFGTVVCIGGGVGVAPVFPQAKGLKEAGNKVISIVGSRSKDMLFWTDKLGAVSDEIHVCTDDGTEGFKGFVTQKLQEIIDSGEKIDRVISIGPLLMMRATMKVVKPHEIPTWVSLNPIMVDGTGMCGGCRVSINGETKFTCIDGPDFDGYSVDFDELMNRQNRFAKEEKMALERYQHECKAKKESIREPMPCQDPYIRRKNFNEVALGYTEEQAIKEAKRCTQCKKPKCIAGCPVNINIPEFIQFIADGNMEGSIQSLLKFNNLPAICGRVCPQEEQCEKLCVLGKKGEPIAIGRLERYAADVAEKAEIEKLVDKPLPPRTGYKVAVIGAGPAGITCAGDLARMGHSVTVFEALHSSGGVLRYGIPEFRLPKSILDMEVGYVEKLGVEFRYNMVIGTVLTIEELFEDGYQAIFVGSGAGLPWFLNLPGENLNGVYSANEFLTRCNMMKGYSFPVYDTPISLGRITAVVGGGNTAMDAARCALRMGSEKVYIVYRRSNKEMPARAEEVEHAIEEGIEFHLLTNPTEILDDGNGWVKGMKCIRMQLGEPDDSGRRRPVPIPGSEYELPVDMVVMAIGQGPNPLIPRTTPELELTRRDTIVVKDEATMETTMKGVYAGGDVVTGGATVISAMGAGKKAAEAIDKYLNK